MNTNETIARDRAIEVTLAPINRNQVTEESWLLASEIVDALRAHPDVLRALASAPDVTSQPAPAGDAELREAERTARVNQYASWVLMAEYDERGRELEQLRELVAHVEAEAVTTERERDEARTELERLRARDEKAATVVQLLSGRRRPTYRDLQADWPELTDALVELARAHDEDGGRDR